ncbi:hypothetical protein HDA40_005466 [Hamadaea flava]|uniref:Transcriptional regulator n=1 Tax=Hamadaea flava TaxID=1742688 RepID=A0ABV8LYY2_9ACTN|nr:hypothetical protein [Hamadaea flava]MCP2326959.1 hypothetical protein [Hamadaea flava]
MLIAPRHVHLHAPAVEVTLSSRPARPANDRLRSARRARRSPSGSGRVLSRQELADACNEILDAMYATAGHAPRWAGMSANYVGALERGEVRWPNENYRAALRTYFNATNADLGLYIDRPESPASAEPSPAGRKAA